MGGAANFTLNTANLISGTGKLVKTDGNTVTISHSNSYSGGSTVSGGTLRLTNLNATGTGNVSNNSGLDLAAGGTYANNISGSGTVTLSGSLVTISGSNNPAAWNVASGGAGLVTGTQNLGSGSVNITGNGSLTIHANNAWSFANILTGGGLLAVDLTNNSNNFDFTASSGTAFSGTVQLAGATYILTEGSDNEAALSNATLKMDTGSLVDLGTNGASNNDMKIHGLSMNGGVLNVKMRAVDEVHVLTVDNLYVNSATPGTVNLETSTLPVPAPLSGNFIDQANLNEGMQVVHSSTVDVSGKQLGLTLNGAATTGTTYTNVNDGHGNNDVEVTYNYTAVTSSATNGQGPGLYVDYLLAQLKTNSNVTLDMTGASFDSFGAKITGTGDLTIMASGTSLTLTSGSNDYSGSTLVDSGTLIAGTDRALGDTSLLILNDNTGFDLNGKSQTIGAFSGSNGSTLNLHGGELTINGTTGDSISNGRLTGSGTINVDSSNFVVNGANAISGQVNIATPAVVTLDDAQGLGTSSIAIGGTLTLDTADDGDFVNVISGSGVLVKDNDGTVVISQANLGFSGTTNINKGALVAEDIAAVGSSNVNLNATGTLAYSNASGTIQNNVSGSGALVIANSDLTATDAVVLDMEQALIKSSILKLDTTNKFGGSTVVNADAMVNFARNGVRMGNVENHGLINFEQGGGFKTAGIGNLSGGGFVVMNVNVSGQQGDLLQTGTLTGTHGIILNRTDVGSVVNGKEKVLLVETADSSAGSFVSGTLVDGVYKYRVTDGASGKTDNNANNWWLVGSGLSDTGSVIINVASVASLGWFADSDSLLKRMGDLRLGYEQNGDQVGFSEAANGDVWVRGYGKQINAGGDVSGQAFRDTLWGTDIGADKLWQIDHRNLVYTGVYGGYGQSSLDFRGISASAESDNYQGGVYATWLNDTGWYADWVSKASYLDNNFDVYYEGGKIRGDYNNWAAGTSLELGRKFQFKDGWFIEPQVQLSYVHIFGTNYQTSGYSQVSVDQSDADIIQVRGGALFGRTITLANKGILQPYVKVMGIEQASSGGTLKAQDGQWRPNYDGPAAQVGAGIIWQLDTNNQLHLDYEAEFGTKYDMPWGINVGYRYQF